MSKYLIPLLIILAACGGNPTPTGTGGQDPAAVQWSINGTGTAVAALVNSTAVSANATQSAAYYQATQQAGQATSQAAAIAQATSAQGTAVAAMTATEQHQLDSAAAIGAMTRDAIEADVLRAEASATAVYMQRRAEQDAARIQRAASVAVFWYWFRWAALGAFCLASLILIPVFGRLLYYRNLPESPVFYDDNGRPLIYHKSYHALPSATITQPATPQPKPQPVFAQRANGADRVGTLPPINSVERQNINNWLVSVLDGRDFNRRAAETYNVGHERADLLIQLAIRQGYAVKGEGQTSPVIPCDNFGEFVDKLLQLPYSNLPTAV